MLWCTWARSPPSCRPATDATRSPNSATAAARTPSRSCKTEAWSPARPSLGPSTQAGRGAQYPQQDSFIGAPDSRNRPQPPPSDRLWGRDAPPPQTGLWAGLGLPPQTGLRAGLHLPLRQGSWKDSASPLSQGSGAGLGFPPQTGLWAGLHLPPHTPLGAGLCFPPPPAPGEGHSHPQGPTLIPLSCLWLHPDNPGVTDADLGGQAYPSDLP